MTRMTRAIVLSLSLAVAAPILPACYAYGEPVVDSVSVSYTAYGRYPRCGYGRYWNGHRCAKRRWAHYHYHQRPYRWWRGH